MSAAACDLEKMEALAFDELPLEQARRALEHASSCAECGTELQALRRDRARFHARAAAQPALPRLELLAKVEARAGPRTHRQRVRREMAAFALCAATLLCVVGLSARSAAAGAGAGLPLSATAVSSEACPPSLGYSSLRASGSCGLASVDDIGRLEDDLGACLVATPAHCR